MCVLHYSILNKGLYSLRRESGYSLNVKGVTSKWSRLLPIYCLMNNTRMGAVFHEQLSMQR